MARINHFEELEAWKSARRMCQSVSNELRDYNGVHLFGVVSQIYRSSGSVMDNIAEGFGRESKNEFIYYLHIAKASCCEVKSQLYRLKDLDIIEEYSFKSLCNQNTSVIRLISGLIRYLKKSDYSGIRKK